MAGFHWHLPLVEANYTKPRDNHWILKPRSHLRRRAQPSRPKRHGHHCHPSILRETSRWDHSNLKQLRLHVSFPSSFPVIWWSSGVLTEIVLDNWFYWEEEFLLPNGLQEVIMVQSPCGLSQLTKQALHIMATRAALSNKAGQSATKHWACKVSWQKIICHHL